MKTFICPAPFLHAIFPSFLCLLLVVKKCKSQTRKEKKRRTTMKAPPSDEKLTNLLISFVWENPRC